MATCIDSLDDISILVRDMVKTMLKDYEYIDGIKIDAIGVQSYNICGKDVSDLHVGLLVESFEPIDDTSIGDTDNVYLTVMKEWVAVDPSRPLEHMEGRVTDIDRLMRVRLDAVDKRLGKRRRVAQRWRSDPGKSRPKPAR